MIHADLHNGNIVFRDDEPYAIDFGRCGFGYHLYDMIQSTIWLLPPQMECFFIMSIIQAYRFHEENALETEGLIEEQPYAQAILRAYINGAPFMFQPLDEVSLRGSMLRVDAEEIP